MKKIDQTTKRKQDHLDICCNFQKEIQMTTTTGFEEIHLIHNALPDIDFEAIDLSTTFLDHKFNYPIFISPITGGTLKSKKINERLARVAEKLNIGFGVGSQRAALENRANAESFTSIREYAPNAFVAANLGAVQFNNNLTIEDAKKAIAMINADALVLHLNPLQEVIQPEGNTNFNNLLAKITGIAKELNYPLIVKEVGAGLSYETAQNLFNGGVTIFDVAGAGGTSWSKIEAIRARQQGLEKQQKAGELFKNWGIPTAISTIELAAKVPNAKIISSGGIRNGLEAAKALALGANLVGIAFPLAYLASKGTEKQLFNGLEQLIYELQITMFLIGIKNIKSLLFTPKVATGRITQWLTSRGFTKEELKTVSLRG